MSQEQKWEYEPTKRICITGGTGFIGTHLARALPDAILFPYPEMDLRDDMAALEFIDENRPEILFHLAAQSVVTNQDDIETLSTNILGTYNLLHACKEVGGLESIVHVSTDKVYGNNADAKRTDPLKGLDHPYHTSKLCGDVIAQMYASFYGLPIRIIRTGNIYGPGDYHTDRLIPNTILTTLAGKSKHMRSNGRYIRDYIFIDDLIPAYLRIAEEPPGIYNLGGNYYSVLEVVETILKLMKRTYLTPVADNTQRNEIPFQHVTDCPDWWNPGTSLEDGLRKTIEWYAAGDWKGFTNEIQTGRNVYTTVGDEGREGRETEPE
jgi:CDP-glucose 4,6-dehydratase